MWRLSERMTSCLHIVSFVQPHCSGSGSLRHSFKVKLELVDNRIIDNRLLLATFSAQPFQREVRRATQLGVDELAHFA